MVAERRREMRTFIDDRCDLGWETKFLGALVAIPVAGLLGPPLLLLLLILFLLNPGGLGERLGGCQRLKRLPGFRSGQCSHMAMASLLYLLPLSILGMTVIGVDGRILGLL